MEQKKRKKNYFIALSYAMLIAMLPATLLFSKLVRDRMDTHIYETVEESAKMSAEVIVRQFESDMLMLEGLAVRMAITLEETPELGVERMVSTAERYGMKRIAFSFPDGTTLATDGAYMNLKGIDNFERAMKEESLLTTVIPDEADGKLINVYSLPVYKQNSKEVLGVMSAVYSSDFFQQLLSASSFGGEGYTYIIDSMGNVVIASDHKNAVSDLENIFDYLNYTSQDIQSARVVRDNLQNRISGFFDVDTETNQKYACYLPLGINDWYVISAVPKSVAEVTQKSVMLSVVIYCSAISVAAVFVVLSIRLVMREKNKALEEALYVDTLTGGRSYEKFRIDCKERLRRRTEKKAVFVFLDIDNFNLVSTLYGHEESLNTLCRIYAMIQDCVGENGITGRNSSDQFCVMYFYNEQEEFEKSIQKFITSLHDNAQFANMLRPTIGIYQIEDRTEGIYDMMNKARIAHDAIKSNESSSIINYYDSGFRDTLYQDRHMEEEMEFALEKHEFVPFLQPKYDSFTGKICGAEALIRWITEDGQIIPPGKFIPLAENNGFVRFLDREMFSMVCRLQKDLIERGITPVPVSVNVSRQLLYDKNFADDYINHIKDMGLPSDLVELEITESALFEDLDLFRDTLIRLRNHGFRILMDDFGTGYSSLMMLHTMPLDVMKLDKSFIDDYKDDKGSSIIQCVLNLAKQLRIPVVAEGVETEDQYLYLKERGCEVIQGYYFSKPVASEEYISKIS